MNSVRSQFKKARQNEVNRRRQKRIDYSVNCLAIVIFLLLGLWLTGVGLNLIEKAECRGWKKESEQQSDYHLTHWQARQCQEQGVAINAPVK